MALLRLGLLAALAWGAQAGQAQPAEPLPAAQTSPSASVPDSPGGSARARRNAPLQSFTVSVTDGVFEPKTLQVPAHTRIKLELLNHGPGPLEFENAEMNIEKVLGPGARSFVVLPPQPPGDIECVDEYNPVTGVLVLQVR
ncbi:hypothetical protein MASR1M59_01430 [Melaminivora sp.]